MEDKFASAKAFNDRVPQDVRRQVAVRLRRAGYGGVRTVLEAVKNAGSVETEKVSMALEALKYDFYKGPQYYRKCDHQSVQSVFIIKSKSKDMRNESTCSRSSAPTSPTRPICGVRRTGHKA